MQQTLLTICALLCFGFFALGRHRANAQNERDAVAGEVELMATEQARALLTQVAALPFDNADVGASQPRTSPTGLTAVLGPEAGETAGTTPVGSGFNDADDWNGYSDTVTPSWDDATITSTQSFTRTVTVRYVSPVNPGGGGTQASPTLAKEIVVTIVETPRPQGRPTARVELKQVITPSMR